MYISIQSLNYETEKYPDLSEVVKIMKGYGAKYLDVAMLEGWQGINPSDLMDASYFDTLFKTLQASGMVIDSLNCAFQHQVTTRDEEEFDLITEHFKKVCELARLLKVRNITVGPGRIQSRDEVAANIPILLKRLPLWAEIAMAQGVAFSVENHQGTTLEHIDDVARLMKEVYPAVGLTFDPSHMEMQGIPLATAKPVMPYVIHSHIRGASLNNMQEGLEKNTLDIPACIEMLKEGGYDQCVAIEYFLSLNDGKELPATIALLEGCGLTL